MCRAWWSFLEVASLALETTDGVILVAFWPKRGLRSNLRVPNFVCSKARCIEHR